MARFRATLIFGSRAASFNLFLYALALDISSLRQSAAKQLGHIHDLHFFGLQFLDPFPELDKAPGAGGDNGGGAGLQELLNPVGGYDMAYFREDHLEPPSAAAAGGPLPFAAFYVVKGDSLDGAQDLPGFLCQAEVPGEDTGIVVGDNDLVGKVEAHAFFYFLPDDLQEMADLHLPSFGAAGKEGAQGKGAGGDHPDDRW